MESSTVTEITLGLYGFEVTTSGANHAFAVHSADVASEWVTTIRETIVRTAPMPHRDVQQILDF